MEPLQVPRLITVLLCLALAPALLSSAARAACPGTDLILGMPETDRAALRAAAREHPYAEGILWRATKGDRTVHLVGTMHLYDPRHAAMMDRLEPMLSQVEAVFLEVGAGDQAKLQRMIAEDPQLAFLTDGPTLPELLAPEDWDRLSAALADRGVPAFLASKMKPWMALANLGMTRCDFDNIRNGLLGLDSMIIKAAVAQGKPPVALEPIDTALKIFAEFTQAEQLMLLRLTLAQQADDSADQAVTLSAAYFREEIQLIWEFALAQSADVPGMSEDMLAEQNAKLEEILVTRRNKSWMGPILTSGGDALVAVGAMHLPGEYGLLALLAQNGFAIERLPVAP